MGSKLLKGGLYRGSYRGLLQGLIKGDTRSLNHGSYENGSMMKGSSFAWGACACILWA